MTRPTPATDDRLSLKHLLGTKPHNPTQIPYILAPEFEVTWVGGMGAGKSFAACAAAIRHGARFPSGRILIGRKTYDEMLKNPKPLFFDIVKSKGLIRYFDRPLKWDYREGTNFARMLNGAEFVFSNLDDPDKFKNVEYSFVYISQLEEVDFEVYQMLLQRCRLPSVPPSERHVISEANDEGDNWIRKRFLTYEPPHIRSGEPHAQRKLFRGSSWDNPHLDEGARAQLRALPPDIQAKYVYATMDAASSRLIPELRVIEPFEVPAHWPRWVGIDPARSTGTTCALWITVNPDKDAFKGVAPNAPHFYQEYWESGREAEIHTNNILQKERGRRSQSYVMDRTAWNMSLSSTKTGSISVAQLYVRAGLPISPSQGDEWTRVLLYLEAQKRGLTVANTCFNLIRQAPQYKLSEQRGRSVIRAKEKYHSIDAGGYALSILPTRVSALDLVRPEAAFRIQTEDQASRLHWERTLSELPLYKNGESVITPGMDEDEMHRPDGVEPDMVTLSMPTEDWQW